jgi:nucleotide-binding universal stress UspA family protein
MSGLVVGYDGSACSFAALRWAAQEAKVRNGKLLVISAVEQRHVPGQLSSSVYVDPPEEDLTAARERVDAALSQLSADMGESGMPEVEVSVPIGNAAALLIDASREADLLVVGSTGNNIWIQLLLGSVSTVVTHHSHCPVTVVRS